MDNTFLAIVLLIGCFLLGLLIGWLIWGRKLGQVKESLAKAEKTLGDRDKEIISLKGQLSTLEAAAAAPDDLTLIEGIGPKIQGLLYDAGIVNYNQLAATPVSRLEEILDAAGPRYRMADPTTWPEQARLAAEGKWDDLQKYQDDLKGGRIEEEDLTKIEGIGPKIAAVLQDAGLLNYALLADAPIERLREVLAAAGPSYQTADPSTWPEQARLAAEAKWDELAALQDRLLGGRQVDDSGDA